MRLGLRLFLGVFLIVGVAAFFVMRVFVDEVKPGVRQAMEATLADTAAVLAELAGDDLRSGHIADGAFAIDQDGHRIRFHDQALDLTRYEYALLAALLQRPGAILSRAQLMDRGWDDADSGDRTVDTHVKTLRAKLRAAGAGADPIRTHRGLGYSLDA